MINPTQHLLYKASNKDVLNILCGSTHERYQTNLCKTGHNFYAVKLNQHFKKWDERYGKMPDNYVELPDGKIPSYLCFDLVLVQHIFGQYQELVPIASQMSLPTVRLEHTTYVWNDGGKMSVNSNNLRCNANIFITDHSISAWNWQDKGDTYVVKHGVDTELFKPQDIERNNTILTVANDYPGRDYVLNFTQYKTVTQGLPTSPVGDSPGFSKPATSVDDLIETYNKSSIFLNTAHLSPIPSSVLESAAMECAIVSCNTCGLSEFFTNGYDAFLTSSDEEMREKLELLLQNPTLARDMGKKARQTILTKCSIDRFTSEWNTILNSLR